MARHQKDHIFRKGGNWYGRWWDDVIVNGRVGESNGARN
jgi:hypothetical protein